MKMFGFFFLISLGTLISLLRVIPCVLLTASFQLGLLRSSHKFSVIQILDLNT